MYYSDGVMILLRRTLVSVLCGLALCPDAVAAKCDNIVYKSLHPYECAAETSQSGTIITLAGIAAAAGTAGIALAMTGGGGGGGATPMPTLPTYDHVGGDVTTTSVNAAMTTPEYSRNSQQYNDIRLAYSIARGYTGRGSTVAIFDTGQDYWHGGAVAGFVTANVAPNADTIRYQIAYTSTEFIPFKQIGNVIRDAQGDIYNNSWNTSSISANAIHSRNQIIALTDKNFINQISDAAARDKIFVWSAGNDGRSQSGALSALPRVMPELQGRFINVVAWDSETGKLADFSNACGVTKQYCITAPGAALDTGDKIVGGTSFAAPIVSGAIAVIREAFPYLSATEITEILLTTARDIGSPGIDEIYGHGMLDLERATRPIGAPLIPVANEMMQPLNTVRVASPIAHNIKSENLKLAYFDRYGRAFQTNLNDYISSKTPSRAMERLREDNKKLSMNVGKLELGFKERPFILAEGFLKADNKAGVSFAAFDGTIYIGEITVFNHASIGISNPTPTPESMISHFSSIYTTSFSVKAKLHDWTFQIATFDTIIDGNMYLKIPTHKRYDGTIIYDDYKIDMTSRPSMEYSVGYKFITATLIDNPYGRNEFFIMAKNSIPF